MPQEAATTHQELFNNDPSAGSPTETLLRLLLPLNDQVWSAFQQRSAVSMIGENEGNIPRVLV